MLWAILAAAGELGYAKATVGEVVRRAGTGRQSFYNQWANRHECFVEAHRLGMQLLMERVFEASASGESWREQLRGGLTQLLDLLVRDLATAQALFIEVHSCKEALPAYYGALDRFAGAIDKARDELDSAHTAPPPRTSAIVVGGIEQIIRLELIDEGSENVWRLLPDLMHFAVLPYLGPEAAQAELASAPLAPSPEGARQRRQRQRQGQLDAPAGTRNGRRGNGALR